MYSWPTSNTRFFSLPLSYPYCRMWSTYSHSYITVIYRGTVISHHHFEHQPASAITSAQQQFPSNCAKSACYFISIKLFVFFVEWNYTRNTCPPRYVSMNIYFLHIHRVCCYLTRSYSCMFVVYWKSASPACNLWSNPFPINPRARTRRRKIAAIWFWFQGRWMW